MAGRGETAATQVLVVDDDASIRDFINIALTDEGYEVAVAENGAEALDILGRRKPDLILLDMRMPVMDGWMFVQAYRRTTGPHAPIMVLTAARDAADRAEQVRADAYLSKPFHLDALLACVRRLVTASGPRR